MKKILNSLMILATFAASFASCTKEINNQEEGLVVGKMKTVTVKTDIATRTTLDNNHENIIWSTGDKISIFNDQDITNLQKEYASGEDLVVSVPAATEEIYAHYPYFSGNESGPTSVSVYIGNNQTQKNPGELNGYNYPMVAKGTIREETQGEETVYKAIVSFYPVASALALNIYHSGLSGTETVKSVTVTPSSNNTGFIGKQITDLTANNIKYTSAELSTPITVTLTNPLALSNTKPADKQTFDGQIYVCLAKQSYANVKFEIQTNKGTYTISSNNTPFDCVNNDFVPVNINLNKATDFVPAQELSGTYVILAQKDDSYYAMANTHKDNDNRLDEENFTKGTTSTANRAIVWSITKNGDYYTITDNDGKYLTASSSNNANVKTEVANCSIIANSDGSYSVMQTVSDAARYLSRNDANQGFAFYGSTSQNCKLYLDKIALQAPPILTWGEDAIVIEADDDNTHEVALTATDATSVTLSVKNETETAEVDWLVAEYSEGTVTYTANKNTSVVRKAVIIATATNTYGSVTAKINVTQKADNSHIIKGVAWGYTFTGTDFAQANTAYTATDNGLGLSFKSSIAKSGFEARGVSFGAAKGQFDITVSGYSDGVESIKLIVSSNAAGNTISATVDGEAIGSQINIANANNVEISFVASSLMQGGDIVFSINDATKSVWIKSIAINPAPASVTGISVEDYTSSYAVSTTGSYSFDGKVYANYSDGSKVELTSSDYSMSGSVNLAVANTYPLTFTYGNFSQTINITVSSSKESYTITWNSTNNSKGVSGYTATWSVTSDGLTCSMVNWNNNNNGWNYVKAGRNGNASVATITTSSAIPEAIKTVTLTIDAVTASKINSLKLYVSAASDFTNAAAYSFDVATGNKSVTISSPSTNCYYKIEADCASGSSNGLITVSKLVFSTK